MSDTVSIRITADTSGVEAGIQEVRGDLGELKSTVQSAADSMSDGFAGMRGAVERSAQSMDALAASMHGLKPQEIVSGLNEVTSALKQNSAALQEMAAKSGEGKSGFGKLVEGISGAAGVAGQLYQVGMQAAQAIVAMGESSEKVTVLSKQLGMSTHQVQLLQAMAKATGTDFTKLSQSTAMLDKNFSKSPDTFKKLGIDIKAGSDQMTILTTVADKFAKTADGPQKTAMAIKLMGQAGAEAIPFLNQGGAAISALAQKTESYGAVNDEAIKRGTKLGESVNEAQLAWSGMGNVLTEALAPVLTEIVSGFTRLVQACVESYNSGGIVAGIFQVIVQVIERVGVVINTLAGIFQALWDAVVDIVGALVSDISDAFGVKTPGATKLAEISLNLFKDAWQILKDSVTIVIEVIKGLIIGFIDQLTMMGTIARDVFTLNWGAIEGDWQSGLDRIQKHATETAKQIKTTYADLAKTMAAAAKGQAAPSPANTGGISHVAGDTGGSDRGRGHSRGGSSGSSGRGSTPKSETAAGGKKSVVDADRAELQDKLQSEKSSGADAAQIELKFWKDKLAATKAGAKEWGDINKEVEKAQDAVDEKTQQKELTNTKSTLAIKADLAKTEITLAKAGLQDKLAAIDEEERAGKISAVQALAMRNDLNRQLRQLDVEAEEQDHNAKLDALNAELGIAKYGMAEYNNIFRQIEQLNAEHANRLRTINAQNAAAMVKDTNAKADAIRAKWQSIFQPIVQSWTQSLQGMINGTTNLRKALLSIGNAIETEAIQWMTKVLTRFLVNEMTKTAAAETGAATRSGIEEAASVKSIALSAITALKQIVHQAAVAAAGAYAAIARIPYVGPVLAPAAAAAALYGVYALGKSVLSAEGGLGEVPSDGTLISAHAREMVLPASLAVPLRQMLLSGGAANNNAPRAVNDGGTAFHYHDHAGTRTPADIAANLDAFARTIKKAHRAGKLGFTLPTN